MPKKTLIAKLEVWFNLKQYYDALVKFRIADCTHYNIFHPIHFYYCNCEESYKCIGLRSDLKESLLQSPSEGQSQCFLYSFTSFFSFKPTLLLRKINPPILNTLIFYLHWLYITWSFSEPFFSLTSGLFPSNLPENQWLTLSGEEI